MNITLSLRHTRRVTGTNDQGPYDFISIPAKTEDGKWAEVSLTPVEYAGIQQGVGVLDKVEFPNAAVEPRKDGAKDRNGNVRLVATVDWADAKVTKAPFPSKMPTLDELTRIAEERARAAAAKELGAPQEGDIA